MDPNNQTEQPDGEVVYCTPDPRTGRQPEYYASEQPVHAATSEQPVHAATSEHESDTPRRRGRSTGDTYRKKNKEPINRAIDFGPDGNKIGPSTGPFANSLGQIARDHVPIIYPEWKKVPEKIKNDCWQKIKVGTVVLIILLFIFTRTWSYRPARSLRSRPRRFDKYLLQEEWPNLPVGKRDVVLKSLGNRWKEHKSRLHRNYILSENDEDPRARYHIPPDHWDEFVRHCSTDEFKVLYIISYAANLFLYYTLVNFY